MNQPALNFTFPVNPWNPGTQNYTLFEHMRTHRAVTTKEIHQMGMDCARVRDLRKKGLKIDCRSIPGVKSNRLYLVR